MSGAAAAPLAHPAGRAEAGGPAPAHRPPQTVGILGGMGPAAGADFVRLFVQACARQMAAAGRPVTDQGFPEHWLAQVPVPDRSRAMRSSRTSGRSTSC